MWEKTPSIQLCKISRLYFDNLDWSPHTNRLCHKLVKANAMLCKPRHYVNEATIK